MRHVSCRLASPRLVGLALAAASSLTTLPAANASTPTVWQGNAFVTAVSAGCAAVSVAVDDYYLVVYRPKLAATDPAEGLGFYGERASLLVTSTTAAKTLQGSGTDSILFIGSHAQAGTETGTHTLTVTPSAITASTLALTISGTVGSFFSSACAVTLRAALVLRP